MSNDIVKASGQKIGREIRLKQKKKNIWQRKNIWLKRKKAKHDKQHGSKNWFGQKG